MSPHTMAAYRRDLRRYAEFLAEQGIDDPSSDHRARWSPSYAGDSCGTGRRSLAAGASVARAVVAVRSLHRFAVDEGLTARRSGARGRSRRGRPGGCRRR